MLSALLVGRQSSYANRIRSVAWSSRLPNVGGCNSIAVSGRLLACMKTGVVQSSPMSVSHFVLHAILSLRSFVAQASLFKSSICTTRISLCCAKSSLFSVVSRVVFRHVNKTTFCSRVGRWVLLSARCAPATVSASLLRFRRDF